MTDQTQIPILAFRPDTKIARLVAVLGEGSGASLEEMMEATGWQAHSVRVALTGLRERGMVITHSAEGSMPLWSAWQPRSLNMRAAASNSAWRFSARSACFCCGERKGKSVCIDSV